MSSSKEEKKQPKASGKASQQGRGKGSRDHRPKQKSQKAVAGARESKQVVKKKLGKPFESYMSAQDVSHGLKRGELIKSVIKINKKNFEQSFVTSPDGGSDIFISTLHARNRALEGDVVVIRLIPSTQSKNVKTSDQTDSTAAAGIGTTETAGDSGSSKTVPGSCKNGSVAEKCPGKEGEVMELGKSVTCSTDTAIQPQKMGQVVFIMEKKHSRVATGNLKAYDKADQTAIFAPADHRLPRVLVPLSDCPDGYVKRPTDFSNILFVGRITEWPADSPFACGRLARSLGEAGQIEPETEGFLIEYGIDSEEFPPEVLDCLPKNLPWKIPEDELAKRRDLRSECIFTIDPATARDLDDALHCKRIGEGLFQVGVHIADVSYFVRPKTALDKMARERATSVYLVQKVIPMLPRLLCEELCSLNANEDRLAFSVIWSIDKKGNVHDEWFGRTVIRSCAKMAYGHAQQLIEDPNRQWNEDELPDIAGGHSLEEVICCVHDLQTIAKSLRRKRFSEGALRLDQPKLSFSLDSKTGLPNGCGIYELKDSNRLIEEFMLLANIAVSHRIYKAFPHQSLLRRHQAPQSHMLDQLVRLCSSYGIKLDASSSASLHSSMQKYSGEEDMAKALVLTSLLSRPMQVAKYFCTGCLEDVRAFRHYALNVPLYTHFTSPIRRYADVIVHRLLAASLGIDEPFTDSADVVEDISENCNDKRKAAKRVQELSNEMFFAIFIQECGPLFESGRVINVMDKSFDVLVLKFGIVVRVYCEQLPLKSWKLESDGTKSSLRIVWKRPDAQESDDRGAAISDQSLGLFAPVEVKLFDKGERLKYAAVIARPSFKLEDECH